MRYNDIGLTSTRSLHADQITRMSNLSEPLCTITSIVIEMKVAIVVKIVYTDETVLSKSTNFYLLVCSIINYCTLTVRVTSLAALPELSDTL